MGIYSSLHKHLSNTYKKDQIVLNFSQIEKIINKPLPKSASKYEAWWSNSTSHSHARAWLDAGWRVKKPKSVIKNKKVTFVRNRKKVNASKKQKLSYDIYVKQYQFLTQMVLENQENYEKTILTLSSSFLALSVSLLAFYKNNKIENMIFLYYCWGCFFLSILLILMNFKFSEKSLTENIERLELMLIGEKQESKKTNIDVVEIIYFLAGSLFMIGIVLLMLFYISQIN